MKKSLLNYLFVFTLVFATNHPMLAQSTPPNLPPGVTMEMVDLGDRLFHGEGMCSSCHGETATGLIGPDLTDSEWLQAKGSYLSILQVVLSGVSADASTRSLEMPPRGGAPLDDSEVHAVAAYVWRVSHPGEPLPPGVSPAMTELGQQIFSGKGTCIRCHGADARGDLGPDLTDSEWLQAKGDYLEIVNTINSGVTEKQSTIGVPMPPRGGSNLSSEEVHAVGAYVWYLSHRN